MNPTAHNFYAVWRENCRAINILRDGEAVPPERFLQSVWQHQRLKRDQLLTADGRSVRVLHPGFMSAEGGPDFRGAVLQFGDEPPVSGDVEIDLQTANWHAHGHDQNPNFKGVILHVVWETGATATGLASDKRPLALPLKNHLDSPASALMLALENESGLPDALRGKCFSPLRDLDSAPIADILHAAAKVRFKNKTEAILARKIK